MDGLSLAEHCLERRLRKQGMDADIAAIVDVIPDLVWTAGPDGGADFINHRWNAYTGLRLEQARGDGWLSAIHPDDLTHIVERWRAFLQSGCGGEVEGRLRRFDGEYRWFLFRADPLRDETGTIVKWCGANIDIEGRKQAEMQLAVEKHLLEMIASGQALDDVLAAVCRFVEEMSPDCLCGVYPIDWSGPVFKYGVAPSLPASYVDPIKGWPVRADVAPCGTTAFTKNQMVIADVETDPVWRDTSYRDHVVGHGLRAVWSTPICSLDGRVFGTFCIYLRQPASPTARQQELISHATHIASIALDKAQTDDALRVSERELRRANAYLTDAQRLSKTGSFTWDVLADEHNWSAEIRRIFGFGSDVPVTMSMIQAAVHPDDAADVERVIGGAVEGQNFGLVFRIVAPGGVVRYADVVGHRIEEITDRPVFVGALHDVTEAKIAEAALKASEAELRRANSYFKAAQRLSRTGSFTWYPAVDVNLWSEEVYRIFEVDPAAVPRLGMIRDNVHPDDAHLFDGAVEKALQGQDWDLEFRVMMTSGAVKHIQVFGNLIGGEAGQPAFVGAVQDVTARKVVEEELRRSEAYLVEAQRLSRTGSFTWDVTAEDSIWSDEMFRIFDVPANTEGGMNIVRRAVHPDDVSVLDALRDRLGEAADFDVELRVVTASGLKYVHVVAHRVDDTPDRPVFVGALQDITDRKVAEEGLDRARRELAHVSRVTALGALTASIAHEVNQPLAGIVTNAGASLRMLAADPPNIEGAQATAQRTIRDANRAADVIKRLRALFARQAPGAEPVDLNDAAREVLALSSGELQPARVVLQTDLADDLPTIPGDRVQLQQVILNLVLNAAQAMRTIDGRPRELRLSTATDGEGQVRLSVRDQGVGADVEHLEQLFNAFYTTKPDGMGVGLSVSRSIVEAHGGRLWASANEGPGLTVSFSLPIEAASRICDSPE
jgi:PAS domain S-box-containing protein